MAMRSNTKTLELALLAVVIGLAVVGLGAKYHKQMKTVLKQSSGSFGNRGW